MRIKKRITRSLIKTLPHAFPMKLSLELRSFVDEKPIHYNIHFDSLSGYIEGQFKKEPEFDWLKDAQLAILAFAHLSI
jgi:hypothetical protein